MSIKLINIDDRLIHGQVATTWVKDYEIESIIIVNDAVSIDPVQRSVAGIAVPNVKVSIFSVSKFIEILKSTEIKKITMLLFTNPQDVLTCCENGLELTYLNVSGMRFNEKRKRIHKNMSVTQTEKDAFEALIDKGVDVWMQTTTRDSKEKVIDLLKKF